MSTPSQRNFSHRPLWRSPASCDELLRSIESWDEFLKVVKGLGKTKEANKWKGDIFERLVQLFLQHSPEYQLQLETVWLYAEIPVKLKEQLNLSDNERGIDLLAKTKKGEYWGVQAKYRADESGSMPLRKLGTFGTQVAAVSKGLSRGLICATKREKTPDFANATFDFEHILLDRWESLPAEFWEAVRQAAAGKKVEPLVPRNPHQYQMAAIDAATLHFIEKANRRGKLIMPCGTGKSLMGYWTAIVALKATTVVVAVPSLDLIRQTFAAWAREAVANRLPLDALIVCSDKSTSSEGDTHTSDLSTPVTTDPGEIRAWLNAPGAEECVRVVFVTYQSGKVLADAVGRFQFDVGLFDEAHKTAGPEGKANQHLLHEENLRIQRRVFMTATERYYVGESDEVVGMNDVKIYGERYHYMSFGDAIAQGILADYSVVLMDVSESDAEGYRELIEERIYVAPEQSSDSVLLPERLTAEDLGAAVALRKAIHKYRLRHAISFHSRNRYAKDFVAVQKALNGKGLSAPIDTYRVSSDLSAGQRHKQIKGFEESNRALISNARCLTEGVDVPGIDLVMFAQPRQSKVDIVQAVGRALRKPADQLEKHGYVLVPILVKDGDLDLEEIVNGSGFENLVSVLKAMATVDADVTERISIVLGEGTRKGGKKGPGSSGTEDVIPRALDLASFADALRLRAWDRLSLIKPRVTIEQILQWADAHKERTGKWPTVNSGNVIGVTDETWMGIGSALISGGRGLHGGSSLAKLLQAHRAVRNPKNLPLLTEAQILAWADDHYSRTSDWPRVGSGKVFRHPGETWYNINAALNIGLRGMRGGSSLAKLLSTRRGVTHIFERPKLTERKILEWADAYKKREGRWPDKNSGEITDTDEKWMNINAALQNGGRGLPKGSSLAKLLKSKRGRRNRRDLPPLSVKQILEWADAYKKRTNRWPKNNSGDIPEAPGETWAAIEDALNRGTRGLSGDANSGSVTDSHGEKWSSVDGARRKGTRAMSDGSNLEKLTLARLLKKERVE